MQRTSFNSRPVWDSSDEQSSKHDSNDANVNTTHLYSGYQAIIPPRPYHHCQSDSSNDPQKEFPSPQKNFFDSSLDVYLPLNSLRRPVDNGNKYSYHHGMGEMVVDDVHADAQSDVSTILVPDKPVPFTPPRKIKQCPFGYRGTSKELFGYGLKKNAPPEKKKLMEKAAGAPLIVEYNANGSPCKAWKEVNGKSVKLLPSMKAGDLYTFSSETHAMPLEVIKQLDTFKSSGRDNLARVIQQLEESGLKLPSVPLTQFSGSTLVTLNGLESLEGTRKEDPTNQRKVLGISSKEVFINLRAVLEESDNLKNMFHILHIRARSLPCTEGADPHSPQNFVAGTAAGNAQHTAFEETAKSLVTEHGAIVYSYRINSKQEIFNADWHLCQFIEFEIHDVKQELLTDYHAKKIGIDQIKGTLLKSFTLDTLAVTYPHWTDRDLMLADAHVQKLLARGFTSKDEDAPSLKRSHDLTDRKQSFKKPRREEDTEYTPDFEPLNTNNDCTRILRSKKLEFGNINMSQDEFL